MKLVRHLAELRSDASNRHKLIKIVVSRARTVALGLKVRRRTLRRWITEFNRIGPDGLSASWSALVDRHGRSSASE